MTDFEDCLKRRGLIRFTAAGPDVVVNELRAATEDMADSIAMLEQARWKRATITAYYVMFHSARALMLSRGYAEKSHYCLLVGFRELYGQTPEGARLALAIERARILQEKADYESDFTEDSARSSSGLAEEFVDFATRELSL
ncbi:MAG TPA: HEPN domain-containing protein [Coriobacteriia bacterium]